jgi:hypothetical protein
VVVRRDVELEELKRKIRLLADTGFGGVEIQPFVAGIICSIVDGMFGKRSSVPSGLVGPVNLNIQM